MDDRFDREFYRSAWQRIQPVGPYGIQPFVRTPRSGQHGLIGLLAAFARGVTMLRSLAAMGVATRPLPLTTAPRAQG